MIVAVLIAVAAIFFILGKFFHASLPLTDAPVFVNEKPPLPRPLAHVADCLDRWRAEGRLDETEHERLMGWVRSDARAASLPTKKAPNP